MKAFFASLLLAFLFSITPSMVHAGVISENFKTGNACGFPGNACCDTQAAIDASKADPNQDAGFFASWGGVKDWAYGRVTSLFGGGGDIINNKCLIGIPETDPRTGGCQCGIKRDAENPADLIPLTTVCEAYAYGPERKACLDCLKANKFQTSFGCVDIDLGDFVSTYILRTLLGAAGIYALLSLIYASFKLQVSHGDKERVTKAKEMATASLMGLILIIFSLFILSFIGKGILGLPGFN